MAETGDVSSGDIEMSDATLKRVETTNQNDDGGVTETVENGAVETHEELEKTNGELTTGISESETAVEPETAMPSETAMSTETAMSSETAMLSEAAMSAETAMSPETAMPSETVMVESVSVAASAVSTVADDPIEVTSVPDVTSDLATEQPVQQTHAESAAEELSMPETATGGTPEVCTEATGATPEVCTEATEGTLNHTNQEASETTDETAEDGEIEEPKQQEEVAQPTEQEIADATIDLSSFPQMMPEGYSLQTYDEEEEDQRLPNILPLHGNQRTMNLNPLILDNIMGSPYFKNNLIEVKTYHEMLDELYYNVGHLEPWERGSRRMAGMAGARAMEVRGVSAGGIVSTAYCVMYKLFTMKMTRRQIIGMLKYPDAPFIRGIGFLYIRYCQPPDTFWDWFEPYLDDMEEIDPKAGGGDKQTIGAFARSLMHKIDWYSTLFPRIPVPVQKKIEEKMKEKAAAQRLEMQAIRNGQEEEADREKERRDSEKRDKEQKSDRGVRSRNRSRSRSKKKSRSRSRSRKLYRSRMSRSRSRKRQRRSRSRDRDRTRHEKHRKKHRSRSRSHGKRKHHHHHHHHKDKRRRSRS